MAMRSSLKHLKSTGCIFFSHENKAGRKKKKIPFATRFAKDDGEHAQVLGAMIMICLRSDKKTGMTRTRRGRRR